MASATKEDEREKAMATDVIAPGADEPDDQRPEKDRTSERAEAGAGFFHIYKPGQGYWTRMGTAAGALLIAALTVNFLYLNLPPWFVALFDQSAKVTDPSAKAAAALHASQLASRTTIAVCAGFLAVYSLIVFYLMNKPANADFLIATDSEMKKVNWTSRKELFGSTKIVIIFMFLIAFMLFGFDVIFGYFFYLINVLKSKPF